MSDDHSGRLFNTKVHDTGFQEWPKTPRLLKDMTVTEKLDGTNAAVVIVERPFGDGSSGGIHMNCLRVVFGPVDMDVGESVTEYQVFAQSRKRMITPEKDNFGFAGWVRDNATELVAVLGPGRHYGEWWGQGIQRTYGLNHKVFSLFNTDKWGQLDPIYEEQIGLSVVPELYRGPFDTVRVEKIMRELYNQGSNVAAHGWYGEAEGVCVFHHASRTVFKATFEADGPKGGPRDDHGNVVNLFAAADLAKAGFYTSEPGGLLGVA